MPLNLLTFEVNGEMRSLLRTGCFILAACLLLNLAACRYSNTLEEIIYDQFRDGQINFTPPFDISRNNEENEEHSDDLQTLDYSQDALRADDLSRELPLPDLYGDDDIPASGVEYNPLVESDVAVPLEQDAPQISSGQNAEAEPEPAEEPTDAQGHSGDGMGGLGTEGEIARPDAFADTYKQVVDAYGRTVIIPEDVRAVTAVDSLAVLTLILGGADILSAANADLLNSPMVNSAFHGLGATASLWDGKGDSHLSQAQFSRLLELSPELVLEESGSGTFTNEQISQLREAGVAYLVLPTLTNLPGLITAAEALGTVLGNKSSDGGMNAPERASEFVSWLIQTQRMVSGATEEEFAYTLYISEWDEDARYRLYNESFTTLSGTGCAVVSSSAANSTRSISSYLAYANIDNTISRYGISPRNLYFTPLISAFRTMDVSGHRADGMVTAGQKLLEQGSSSLGTADFRILLVPDAQTAENIANCELWAVYPRINSGDGSFNSDGFLDEEGNLVRTQISAQYEVVVPPQGVCSWTDSGCEGILLSVWAAWRFFDAISEDDMRGYIMEFYSLFYNWALSDAELDEILSGAPYPRD